MQHIRSADNPTYKAVVQLKQKKYRDEQNKYLIEGPNLIREAILNRADIELILMSEDFQVGIEGGTAVVLPPALFRKLSDTETPQGIIAVVRKKIYSEHDFFFTGDSTNPVAVDQKPVPSNIIVLDRLQDPGNIGTILRTADAAGYQGAVLLKGTADIYSSKIVRAAAGSLFRLPVLMTDTAEETIRLLKQHDKKIICTAPGADIYYYEAGLKEDAAVIIGNEGNGVCREFLEGSDCLVKIPMEGTVESLNAAVAAAVLMYESVRQKHKD